MLINFAVMISTRPFHTIRCQIQDQSQVGESRRIGQELTARLGFDDTQAGKVAIVITELGGNIIKHAHEGELLLRPLEHDGQASGLELLAIDAGPGMNDVEKHMADGYSTAGSPGTGLGAVRRLADDFAIRTIPQQGTVIVCRLRVGGRTRGVDSAFSMGAISVPKPGESIGGDGWAVARRDGELLAMVVDGLGHGVSAAEATNEAVRVFNEQKQLKQPAQLLDLIHAALQKTRGAAVAIAALDAERGTIRYAGLGNIAGIIVGANGERGRSLISQNGTAGVEARRLHEYAYAWPRGAQLVMHSDGLRHWDPSNYSDLMRQHPALVAGVLYRDFRRQTDDATVLVLTDRVT